MRPVDLPNGTPYEYKANMPLQKSCKLLGARRPTDNTQHSRQNLATTHAC
uniref:Uncharacterized protein n=1 Tax=Rhizophora mucronata TaxID=61149 RepID=A0A2P2QBN7_RHIMU